MTMAITMTRPTKTTPTRLTTTKKTTAAAAVAATRALKLMIQNVWPQSLLALALRRDELWHRDGSRCAASRTRLLVTPGASIQLQSSSVRHQVGDQAHSD